MPDEYISRKRVEFELCGGNLPERYKAFVRRVLNDKNLVPAADVAPVVRCKDCIDYIGGMCFRCGLGYEVSVDADDFCSRGVTE